MDPRYSFRDSGKPLYDLLQRILHLNHRSLRKDLHIFLEYKLDYSDILHRICIQGDN